MATTIRLQRTGRKKQASFRIVVTDQAESNSGPALETLGTYNPRTQPSIVKLNAASALDWLHEGAQPTDTVVSIFKKTGVWEKYRAGTRGEALAEEETVVNLGGDAKTSRRAEAAAEGAKLAASRRAEEKATAEAAARKEAEEKAAEAKAKAEAEAAAAEAETAEAEEAEEAVEAEEADEAEDAEDTAAEADDAPEAEADADDAPTAEAEAEADAGDDAEADADESDEEKDEA